MFIQIYSATETRYEVPVPLILPEAADPDSGFSVGVPGVGEAFRFNVTRVSNGNIV